MSHVLVMGILVSQLMHVGVNVHLLKPQVKEYITILIPVLMFVLIVVQDSKYHLRVKPHFISVHALISVVLTQDLVSIITQTQATVIVNVNQDEPSVDLNPLPLKPYPYF